MNERTRILLADDHPIFLGGLRPLVQAEEDFELVGEASNGLSALRVIREQRPDISLVDLSMPGLNGIGLARRVAAEALSTRVIVLTLHEDWAFVRQALDAGVRGYILKRSAAESLVQAIRAVILGGLYVDPAIANQMFKARQKRSRANGNAVVEAALTERETEVLKLIALGFTNKEIAAKLDVGVKSVETYKARGSGKLGLKTRADLVRYAATQGWLADL